MGVCEMVAVKWFQMDLHTSSISASEHNFSVHLGAARQAVLSSCLGLHCIKRSNLNIESIMAMPHPAFSLRQSLG